MDIGIFRGVITAVLMVLFIALVFWAYSRRRQREFDEAAQLPLDDDRAPSREPRRASRSSGTEQS
jgi:cytochrome c oxidase cbb3-type subunit 4